MTGPFRPSEDQVRCYLRRIGLTARPQIDAAGLMLMHRHHAQAVTWENLDMQLGHMTTTDPGAAYRKIVESGRGGWCYEMNGLLGVMLEALGFTVHRLCAAVMREMHGDFAIGNHLALVVELDEPWLADVGLGSGLLEPVPLREGPISQSGRQFRLEAIGTGWWRFHNAPGSMPPSFDFNPGLTDEQLLAERCLWLQTDPASPFTGAPVLQRYRDGYLVSLIRADLEQHAPEGITRTSLASLTDYRRELFETFDLQIDQSDRLWSLCQPEQTEYSD